MTLINTWLAPIRERIPPDLGAAEALHLQEAITEEALRRFGDFLAGVKAYQNFPAERREGETTVIWEKGTTRLLDYAPGSQAPVVLVIPSLVNRFDILDIDDDFSFLRFLASAGMRPLVIDWGLPGEEERTFDIATYMKKRVLPALDFAVAENGGKACAVMGYCMGGVLALVLALMRAAQVKSLALLATPWDFEDGVGGVPGAATTLGGLFTQQAMAAEAYLEKVGILPPALLQSVFTSFQPLQILEKFTRFAGGEQAEKEARRFVLTEDWLNDGVPLSLPVARETLRDWYGANLTAKGEWRVDGTLIAPAQVTVPAYVLVAEKDKIVPPESSLALSGALPKAELHIASLGHIGLMCSDSAPQGVWQPLADWLKNT